MEGFGKRLTIDLSPSYKVVSERSYISRLYLWMFYKEQSSLEYYMRCFGNAISALRTQVDEIERGIQYYITEQTRLSELSAQKKDNYSKMIRLQLNKRNKPHSKKNAKRISNEKLFVQEQNNILDMMYHINKYDEAMEKLNLTKNALCQELNKLCDLVWHLDYNLNMKKMNDNCREAANINVDAMIDQSFEIYHESIKISEQIDWARNAMKKTMDETRNNKPHIQETDRQTFLASFIEDMFEEDSDEELSSMSKQEGMLEPAT